MTDVLTIAKRRRSSLAAEVAKLDDFISMAEMLLKLENDPTRDADWVSDPKDHEGAERRSGSKAMTDDETRKDELGTQEAVSAPSMSVDAVARNDDGDYTNSDKNENLFLPTSTDEHELVLTEERRLDFSRSDGVGQKIRQCRWMMGIPKGQLAAQLGITTREIQNIELGVSQLDMRRLKQIAEVLEVSASHFFEEEKARETRMASPPDRDVQHPGWNEDRSGVPLAKTA